MKKHNLWPIFLVVLIDMIGLGIVIPVIAPMFLDAANPMLPATTSFASRTFILGLVLATYSFAQFFGAPILGALSDKHGRKKVLIISLAGTLVGYIMIAIAIMTHQLWLLILSRLIDGFTGGNITIAFSSIADISTPKEKVKRFGLMGVAFGLGIIIGPFIGGKLADSTLVSWFNYSTPFWAAAILCLINIVMLMINFTETLGTKKHSKVSFLTGIRHIRKAFDYPQLRTMFIFVFLFTMGFSFFAQFFQVYLIEEFHYTESMIGNFFAFLGVCIVLTQALIVRYVAKRYSPESVLKVTVLMLAIAIFALVLPKNHIGLYFIIPFIAIFNGLTMPNNTAIVSNLGTADEQGEILGINQSLTSLALIIPPLIAGIFAGINYSLPIIISSVTLLLAWIVFMFFFHKKDKKVRL